MRHEKKNALPAEKVPIPAPQRREVDSVATQQEMLLSRSEASVVLRSEISQRHQLEEILRESDVCFSQFIAILSEGVVVHDNGIIVDINPAITTISGHAREELVGKPILNWIISEPCLTIWQSLQAGDERRYEVTLPRRDGSPCPIAVRGKIIVHQGRMRQALIVSDLSERKILEEELLRAKFAATEAKRIKNEFIAMMSHELRTPLNIIIGYADLLLDNIFGPMSLEQKSAVGHMRRSTTVLMDLVTSLLHLRSLDLEHLSLQSSLVLLTDVLAEVEEELTELIQHAGVTYRRDLSAGLPLLQTDREKLKSILHHVLSNAFKFTPEGSVTVTGHPQAGGILLCVTDTGIGIPSEKLTAIFSPFIQGDSSNTRRYGGVGLGLHLVQQFLQLLGGTIAVESTVGQGSRFSLWVPVHRPL
jgi:PAS domain S-box-containing protein